jgi:O-antigen/teichoic acid export membrane protein
MTDGVVWTATSRVLQQLFRIAVTAVLARLLVPEDFGVVGMALIFTGLVALVNEFGLSSAIIQRTEVSQEHLCSAFWVNVMTGLAVWGIAAACSPAISRFFESSLVAPVVSVSSFGFVLGSISIVHRALLVRNLQFGKVAAVDIGGTIANGTASVILALLGMGVWSLVLGSLLGNAVSSAVLWVLSGWRPRFLLRWNTFKELLRFGAYVMGARVLTYAGDNLDNLIVGKLLGPASLGYYSLAYRLMDFPRRNLASIVTTVTFPAFSRIQEEDVRLRKGYLKTIAVISLVTFPLLTGLVFLAPEFVQVVYGPQWEPAVLPLQAMCVAGLFYSVATTTGSIFLSKGRSDLSLLLNAARIIALGLFALAGVRWGIVGVAVAISVYATVFTLVFQIVANRLIRLSMGAYFRSLRPAFVGSSILGVVVLALRRILVLGQPNGFLVLAVTAAVGAGTYSAFLRFSRIAIAKETLDIVLQLPKSYWKRFRQRLSPDTALQPNGLQHKRDSGVDHVGGQV